MQFRIYWFPQIGCAPFELRVDSYETGRALCDALAGYDLFLLRERHRPDFSNMGAVQFSDPLYTGGDWHDCPDDPKEWADELEAMKISTPATADR